MSDNDVELTGNEADDAIENDAVVDGAEPEGFTPPEGMEAELYDNGALSAEKVKSRIDALKAEAETARTNEGNMRKKLSTKGTVPEKVEDYADGYAPAEEYKQFYENDDYKEGIEANLKAIDKLAFENGMTKDQCKAVKDAFNKLIVENGIVEDAATFEARQQEYIKTEMSKLGANAVEVIKRNVDFVSNDNRFNEAEKELLLDFMDTKGAAAVNIVNKMRLGHGGEYAGDNIIPASGASGGLSSDTELAREYYAKDTSPSRRQEIMMQRIEAGRTGRLPQPDKL